jgi:hypothetical protein
MSNESDRDDRAPADPYARRTSAGSDAAGGEAGQADEAVAADEEGVIDEMDTPDGEALGVHPSAEAIVDDPDEPENPDEKTVAETEAARAALSPTARRRRYRGPQSILIMLFVVGLVVATGVYAVIWFQRIKAQDDMADLRILEEREAMSLFQRRSVELKKDQFPPGAKVLPAGFVYQPLSAAERAQMLQLRQRFGLQFKPDDKQNMLINEVREYETARGLPLTPVPGVVPPPAAGAPPTTPAGSPGTTPATQP